MRGGLCREYAKICIIKSQKYWCPCIFEIGTKKLEREWGWGGLSGDQIIAKVAIPVICKRIHKSTKTRQNGIG